MTIKEKLIETKLFDKRDDYNFSIVKLPHKNYNIPSKMFFSSIGIGILWIARATSLINQRMIQQGATT